jgi:hypothetical protein
MTIFNTEVELSDKYQELKKAWEIIKDVHNLTLEDYIIMNYNGYRQLLERCGIFQPMTIEQWFFNDVSGFFPNKTHTTSTEA